jgi:CheY-like chemotaxis protein
MMGASAVTHAAPTAPRSARKLRIFIVENHDDTRLLLRWLLEHLGHEVMEATSLSSAVQKLPGSSSDVLISDIGLPDGTGWEILRALPGQAPAYAIAMSGFGTSQDVVRSQQAGFRHHLVKPVEPGILERLLAEAAEELDR